MTENSLDRQDSLSCAVLHSSQPSVSVMHYLSRQVKDYPIEHVTEAVKRSKIPQMRLKKHQLLFYVSGRRLRGDRIHSSTGAITLPR